MDGPSEGFLVLGNAQENDKRLGKIRFDDNIVQSMNKLIGEQGQGYIPEGDDIPYAGKEFCHAELVAK